MESHWINILDAHLELLIKNQDQLKKKIIKKKKRMSTINKYTKRIQRIIKMIQKKKKNIKVQHQLKEKKVLLKQIIKNFKK